MDSNIFLKAIELLNATTAESDAELTLLLEQSKALTKRQEVGRGAPRVGMTNNTGNGKPETKQQAKPSIFVQNKKKPLTGVGQPQMIRPLKRVAETEPFTANKNPKLQGTI